MLYISSPPVEGFIENETGKIAVFFVADMIHDFREKENEKP